MGANLRRNLFVCVSRIARPSGRNWVDLYDWGVRYGGHCCFQYMWYFSTAHRREFVAVFKVSCFPFLNCFASFLSDVIFLPALPSRTVYSLLLHLDPREKISSPIQDLFCSRKPLTYPGSASVQICSVWTARENWLSAFASTHLLYPNESKLLDSTVIT